MKSYHKTSLSFLVVLVIAGSIYNSHHNTTSQQNSNSVATTTKAGPLNLYPDPKLTPGDILTINSNIICQKGYSKSVRNVPSVDARLQLWRSGWDDLLHCERPDQTVDLIAGRKRMPAGDRKSVV